MNFRRLLVSAIIVVAGTYLPGVLHADNLEILPSRDTTLHSDDLNASNGAGPVFFAGRTNRGAGSLRRALVYFDVTAIPPGSSITSVSVALAVTREPSTPPLTGALRRILSAWGEAGSSSSNGNGAPAETGDATWSHRFYGAGGQTWTTAGSDLAGATSATAPFGAAGTTVTFASTPQLVADVQSWLDTPSANQGWAILGDELTAGSATQFASRQNPTMVLRPRLIVAYTPPPAGSNDVPLFGPMGTLVLVAALVGMGAVQLRRVAAFERVVR